MGSYNKIKYYYIGWLKQVQIKFGHQTHVYDIVFVADYSWCIQKIIIKTKFNSYIEVICLASLISTHDTPSA